MCGDDIDLIDGKPTGSVRISFGYMSTMTDAEIFVSFIEQNFCCCYGNDYDDVIDKYSDNVMKINSDFIGQNNNDIIDNDVIVKGDKNTLEDGKTERKREMERDGEGGRIEGEMVIRVGDKVLASSQTELGKI